MPRLFCVKNVANAGTAFPLHSTSSEDRRVAVGNSRSVETGSPFRYT